MTTKTPIKALIYCHTATKLQKGHNQQQEERCRTYAADHHFDVVATYRDEDISGMIKDRPDLNKLMDRLTTNAESEKPEQYVVIVDSIQCLSRNIKDYLELKDTMKTLGCELHAIDRPLRDTPESNLIENVLLAAQEMEDTLEESA